jgi:replicative DNA helicase
MAFAFPEPRREQFLERPLPNSEESERAILGAILLDNGLIAQAVEHLKPEDFYGPLHRRIFNAMISLFETSKRIDPILIGEKRRFDRSSRRDRYDHEPDLWTAAFHRRQRLHQGR